MENSKRIPAGSSSEQPAIGPRVCIVAARPHVRTFLGECFEELGLTTCDCPAVGAIGDLHSVETPDLVAVDLSTPDPEPDIVLGLLAGEHFRGKVLIFGPADEPKISAARAHGRRLGLSMLPPLYTPCRYEDLRDRLGAVVAADPVVLPPIDLARALREGWLELWYQPKIDIRSLALAGTEALVRMRHPVCGILPPAHFIPDDGDPRMRALSDFVVARAAADQRLFAERQAPLPVAINLPMSYLLRPTTIRNLRRHLPVPPEGGTPIVEINSTAIVRDPAAAAEIADRLKNDRIGVAADDVGAEWQQLLEWPGLSLAEIKVDRQYIAGIADDDFKKSMCGTIVELARARGARTVAEGVETTADFTTVRDLGFDMVQGFLFARPMHPHKFVRTFLHRPVSTAQ